MNRIFGVFMVIILGLIFNVFGNELKEGRFLFQEKCKSCHPLSKPLQQTNNLEEWKAITSEMSKTSEGVIQDSEAELIAKYLNSLNISKQ